MPRFDYAPEMMEYLSQVHPSEVETTVCGVNEQTGQCELPATERKEEDGKERGEVGERAGEGVAKREEAKRYFQIPRIKDSVNGGSCPIDPDMKVCLVVSSLSTYNLLSLGSLYYNQHTYTLLLCLYHIVLFSLSYGVHTVS